MTLFFCDIRPEIVPRERFSSWSATLLIRMLAAWPANSLCVKRDTTVAAAAVGGLYWRYEQWIRNCEAVFDSPVGSDGVLTPSAVSSLCRSQPE